MFISETAHNTDNIPLSQFSADMQQQQQKTHHPPSFNNALGFKLLNSAGYAWNSHEYSSSSELYNKCQVIDHHIQVDAQKRRILKAPVVRDKRCVYNSMMNIEKIAKANNFDTEQEFINVYKNNENVVDYMEDDSNEVNSLTNNAMMDDDRQSETSLSHNGDELLSQARGYQRELVEHCKKENTIIVAPTGAGTFIKIVYEKF